LKKQYKPNIKIERTKREHSKVIVRLPKLLRDSKSLKDILIQKFVHHRKHKKSHKKHHVRAKKHHSKKLRTPEQASIIRKVKKLRKQRRLRVEKRLIRKLKRRSEKNCSKKCTFSRVCKCKGKKIAYTKKNKSQKIIQKRMCY